jgi:hypothetical protein
LNTAEYRPSFLEKQLGENPVPDRETPGSDGQFVMAGVVAVRVLMREELSIRAIG